MNRRWWVLAVRNVLRQRRRSALSLVAIALGMAVLVGLRGLAEGMIQVVTSSVIEGRLGALQVHRAGYLSEVEALPLARNLPASGELLQRIRAVPGVAGVSGRILFGGLASDGTSQANVVMLGVDPATIRDACPRWGKELAPGGRDLDVKDDDKAVAGVALAQGFGITPGTERDTLVLQAGSPDGRLQARAVRVVGVSRSSFRFENKRLVTVPLALAQDLTGLDGRVTEYAVAVQDPARVEQVAAALRAALGPDVEVHTWESLQPFMAGVVRRQVAIVWMGALVFFIVVVLAISNAMVTSVFERVAEIGTLLALGARRRHVRRLFLLEAALLGAGGGVLGALLGWVAVQVAAFFGLPLRDVVAPGITLLRPAVSAGFLGLVVLLAVSTAVVASVWPTWRASRQSPADALRAP